MKLPAPTRTEPFPACLVKDPNRSTYILMTVVDGRGVKHTFIGHVQLEAIGQEEAPGYRLEPRIRVGESKYHPDQLNIIAWDFLELP